VDVRFIAYNKSPDNNTVFLHMDLISFTGAQGSLHSHPISTQSNPKMAIPCFWTGQPTAITEQQGTEVAKPPKVILAEEKAHTLCPSHLLVSDVLLVAGKHPGPAINGPTQGNGVVVGDASHGAKGGLNACQGNNKIIRRSGLGSPDIQSTPPLPHSWVKHPQAPILPQPTRVCAPISPLSPSPAPISHLCIPFALVKLMECDLCLRKNIRPKRGTDLGTPMPRWRQQGPTHCHPRHHRSAGPEPQPVQPSPAIHHLTRDTARPKRFPRVSQHITSPLLFHPATPVSAKSSPPSPMH
jgi:hypothetical protein